MAFLDEAVWRGKVFSGGWVTGSGGDAAVIEPATGAELGRTGIGGPADIAGAARQAAAAQRCPAPSPCSPARHPDPIPRRPPQPGIAQVSPGRLHMAPGQPAAFSSQ